MPQTEFEIDNELSFTVIYSQVYLKPKLMLNTAAPLSPSHTSANI